MCCEMSLALDPRSVDAKESLATVLAGQDRYDEAIKIARETCESNADALSSRVVLAGVLAEAGCLDEGLRIATAAAEAAPEDARVHGALGTVYVKMKDGAAALAAFERMAACLVPEAERLPSSPWLSYLTGRGVALSLLGRHDQAVVTFEEVLRTDPVLTHQCDGRYTSLGCSRPGRSFGSRRAAFDARRASQQRSSSCSPSASARRRPCSAS